MNIRVSQCIKITIKKKKKVPTSFKNSTFPIINLARNCRDTFISAINQGASLSRLWMNSRVYTIYPSNTWAIEKLKFFSSWWMASCWKFTLDPRILIASINFYFATSSLTRENWQMMNFQKKIGIFFFNSWEKKFCSHKKNCDPFTLERLCIKME